jgi:hypothetical protein
MVSNGERLCGEGKQMMNKTNFSSLIFLSHLLPSLQSGQNQAHLFRPIMPPPTIHLLLPEVRICRLSNRYKDINPEDGKCSVRRKIATFNILRGLFPKTEDTH